MQDIHDSITRSNELQGSLEDIAPHIGIGSPHQRHHQATDPPLEEILRTTEFQSARDYELPDPVSNELVELGVSASEPHPPALRRRRAIRVPPRRVLRIPSFYPAGDVGERIGAQSDAPEVTLEPEEVSTDLVEMASDHTRITSRRASPRRSSPFLTFNCARLQSCTRDCSCICHSKQTYILPSIFKRLFGSLFVGYTGLPLSVTKCNLKTCSNHVSRDIRASYSFPTWFVKKTFDFAVRCSFTNGPCFGLSVRNRVSPGARLNMLSLAVQGNIHGMIRLIETRMGSLNDIEISHGHSSFWVCYAVLHSFYRLYYPSSYYHLRLSCSTQQPVDILTYAILCSMQVTIPMIPMMAERLSNHNHINKGSRLISIVGRMLLPCVERCSDHKFQSHLSSNSLDYFTKSVKPQPMSWDSHMSIKL